MRPKATRAVIATALFLVLILTSGCILVPIWWDDHHRTPRMAVVHVHVYDYYTYAPVSWAVVEVYEESWWDWDYKGTWPVNMSGYTAAHGGYLYDNGGSGPQERHLGVEVSASGYYPEWHEIALDYWYPAETLSFYVVRWDDCGDCGRPVEGEPPDIQEDRDLPEDRVKVGEPEAANVHEPETTGAE